MITGVLTCLPVAALPFIFVPDGPHDYVRISFATNMGIVAAGMLSLTLVGEFVGALLTRRPLAWVCTVLTVIALWAVLLRLGGPLTATTGAPRTASPGPDAPPRSSPKIWTNLDKPGTSRPAETAVTAQRARPPHRRYRPRRVLPDRGPDPCVPA